MRERATQLIVDWRSNTVARLCGGFGLLLENASDVLVDFASKSENPGIQNGFFDAQRELFLKGSEIERGFHRRLLEQASTIDAPAAPEPGAQTLSLLDKGDYELSVALETIAERCKARNTHNLYALQERLSALHGGRRIGYRQVPLAPHRVTESFQQSLQTLDIDNRVLLVLFTLFDKYVVGLLDDTLTQLNALLAEAGVLPSIHYSIRRHPRSESTATPSPSPAGILPPAGTAPLATEDGAPGGAGALSRTPAPGRLSTAESAPTTEETMLAITSLLAQRRQASGGVTPQVSPQDSVRHVNQALAIDNPQLQSNQPAMVALHGDKLVVDKQLLLRVRKALRRQRELIQSLTDRNKLAPQEQDVIEIVGMLFEAILDNESIPPPAKTLLSHLHTPFLKIAVNDPSLLHSGDHPARNLLDQMLRVGVRWVAPERLKSGIFPTLQYCVRKILDNPLRIDYAHLRLELETRETQLRQSHAATEKRTLEAERGQAQLAQAREMAHSAVHELMVEHPLPREVGRFLQTIFTDYLSLLLLRNRLDPQHATCREALSEVIPLIEQVASGDPAAATRSATRVGRLVTDLLPHYRPDIDRFAEQLRKPLHPMPATDATPAPPSPPPPDAGELAAMAIDAGTWFAWWRKEREDAQRIKLIWTNPHTRGMLFVDQNGVKVAQMRAAEVAQALATGSLKQLPAHAGGLFNGLLETIRKRLQPADRARA